jgi:hypothetical protein
MNAYTRSAVTHACGRPCRAVSDVAEFSGTFK